MARNLEILAHEDCFWAKEMYLYVHTYVHVKWICATYIEYVQMSWVLWYQEDYFVDISLDFYFINYSHYVLLLKVFWLISISE